MRAATVIAVSVALAAPALAYSHVSSGYVKPGHVIMTREDIDDLAELLRRTGAGNYARSWDGFVNDAKGIAESFGEGFIGESNTNSRRANGQGLMTREDIYDLLRRTGAGNAARSWDSFVNDAEGIAESFGEGFIGEPNSNSRRANGQTRKQSPSSKSKSSGSRKQKSGSKSKSSKTRKPTPGSKKSSQPMSRFLRPVPIGSSMPMQPAAGSSTPMKPVASQFARSIFSMEDLD